MIWVLADHDASDSSQVCTKYSDLVDIAKYQYYASRAIAILSKIPE